MNPKCCAITGGAGALGRELAALYLKDHAKVALIDQDELALQRAIEALGGDKSRVFGVRCNVSDTADLARAITSIQEQCGRIDLWINGAGTSGVSPFCDASASKFERTLEINLLSLTRATRIILEIMENQGIGTIVNVASIAGLVPAPYMTAYCASKAGVVGFTRALQAELQLEGSPVSLVLVLPGFFESGMIRENMGMAFPEWLSFVVSSPKSVARTVYRGLKRRKLEIYPTLNGQIIQRMYQLVPSFTVRSSRALLAKSLKDFVFNRLTAPPP